MKEQHHTFARFWKCALQVNPHAYSANYRGNDHGMNASTYAKKLRDTCLAEKIEVVGLADHGSVADAEVVRKALVDAGIVVFPGFEVATTEKVHWVCLFPEDVSEQQLERYLGRLSLTNPEDGVRPSDLGGQQLLHCVDDLGGFCFAAHATSNSGLLKGKFNNLWVDAQLRAAQIPGNIDDLPPEYKSIALNGNPDYKREHPVALINAKDVAKPDDLHDLRASTFIKMTRPCFASFLMAFKDPESRVRLSDDLQERFYSQIDSISIEGGYFDGLSAEVSGHLNAVIGGRGTGKSTLLECLRYALDIAHKSEDAIRQGDQIVKENLGKAGGRVVLKLRSAANHMKPYTVIRRYGEPPRVIDEQGNESRLHPGRDLLPSVEMYGQNEIYELARSAGALTRVLDRFLPESAEQQARLDSALRKLRENSERLAKAQEQKDEIETQIAQLPKLEEQVRQFKEQGLEEKLKQVPLLEKERQLGPRILEEVKRTRDGHRQFDEALPDLVFLSGKALEGLPHAGLLQRGRALLESLSATLRQKLGEIDEAIGETEKSLESLQAELTQALANAETGLEKEFAKLPVVAGKDGREIGRAYQRLLREIEQVRPSQTRLGTVDALVKEDPLIMDQPEDNLDNAFIAERIVQELRAAKTERQFLFATHNANIPVFGDAEWIGVCSASEDRAEMPVEAQGSIDMPAIRDQVASILEGGKEAFMQRKEKYGFDY